jgi:hypothetical protein
MKQLLAFYYGRSTDDQGRHFAEILDHDDEWLEGTHDYIQWLFPLRERSGANPSAPLIDAEVAAAFRDDEQLRANMRAAFDRMLRFYGLCRDGERIVKGANWDERKENWFVESTHNDLRITRILKSLRTLGLSDEADKFLAALRMLRATEPDCGIADEAFGYWQVTCAAPVNLSDRLTKRLPSDQPASGTPGSYDLTKLRPPISAAAHIGGLVMFQQSREQSGLPPKEFPAHLAPGMPGMAPLQIDLATEDAPPVAGKSED